MCSQKSQYCRGKFVSIAEIMRIFRGALPFGGDSSIMNMPGAPTAARPFCTLEGEPMKDLRALEEIWAKYVYEGELDESVNPYVAEGWKRCRAAGVNPIGGLGRRVDEEVFRSIREANAQLIDAAMPIMQSVFDIVRRTGFLMVLTDGAGYVLETMGDESIMTKTRDLRFIPGALWDNQSVGTNAISVALDYNTAIQMAGAEHYCRTHHGWTCSAAPIHGYDGEVIGFINMSGEADGVHDHTLAVVLAAAIGIEGKLSIQRNAELLRSALEGSADSIVLLGANFRPVWSNSAARRLLGMEDDELRALDFRTLLPDVDWAAKGWMHGGSFADDVRVTTRGGVVRCSAAITHADALGSRTLNVTLKKQKHLIASVNKLIGNRASYTFDDIFTADAEMRKTVTLAARYAHYDGNILIEGESGTGKELIAQAIHNAGSRASGPFVAVNCASLHRDMLDHELFGYEAGASPLGGDRGGSPGKFELAHGGTLFLDEISDIPIEFQAKLLRAVETHRITRVGGTQEIELDIRIIASTNRHLGALASSGAFRGDLYYRLNVLRLEIPPLRRRPGDIRICAERFLARLNSADPAQNKSMSQEFIDGLMSYDWPGNVRELQNGIERAYYATPENVLAAQSLPLAVGDIQHRDQAGQPGSEAGEILSALTLCGGDVEKAAERLGVSRATLYRHIKRHSIDVKSLRHTVSNLKND